METAENCPRFKCRIHVKSQFREKKTDTFRWENFHLLYYLGMRWCYNILRCVLLSNFCPIICQVDVHWRLKTTENFKLLALKWSRSFTRGGRLQEVQNSDLTFGILENWSLRRDGRLWEVVAIGGSTVHYILLCHSWSTGKPTTDDHT